MNIGIPTRDRVSDLRRALLSVVNDVEKLDEKSTVLVVDQSNDDNSTANRENISLLAAKHGDIDFFYVSRPEKIRLAELGHEFKELASASVVPQCVENERFGENRNWITVFFSGLPYVSLDDDVRIAPIRTPLGCSDNYALDYYGLPWYFGYVSSVAEYSAQMRCSGSVLRRLTREISNERLSYATCGVVGNSGLWCLPLVGESGCPLTFSRLLSSDFEFSRFINAPAVLRCSLRRLEGPFSNFMSTIYATSNCDSIVPFVPAGRGEDASLELVYRALKASVPLVELDLMVEHIPSEPREIVWLPNNLSVANVLGALTKEFSATDLCSFGMNISRVLSGSEWLNTLSELIMQELEAQIARINYFAGRASLCRAVRLSLEMRGLECAAQSIKIRRRDFGAEDLQKLNGTREVLLRYSVMCMAWREIQNCAAKNLGWQEEFRIY